MKVSAEKIENQKVVLTIEVEAEELTKAQDRACKRIANRVNIPGFRKGKAPKKIVENHVGKEYILDEAFDLIYPKAFNDALKEQELVPVTRPELDIVTLESGKDLVFKATFTNHPEVTLGEYKGLNVPKEVAEVTDEDVDKQIANFQDRQGKLVDVPEDTAVADGDFTTLDFEGFVDGEPFDGGTGKDYPLQIGSKRFIPGFEDQLIGAKIGEERELHVTFPEDYQAEELAGKPAMFKCTVRSIKHKELPPIDDELAKKVSTFQTLAELKADIRKNLQAQKEEAAKREKENDVVAKIVENAAMEIPDAMVDEQVSRMADDFTRRIESQGITMEQYMQFTGMTPDKLQEQMKPEALKRIQNSLVLEAIAKAENIEISDEKLDEEIAKLAESYKMEADKLKELMGDYEKEQMKNDLAIQAAVDLVTGAAREV